MESLPEDLLIKISNLLSTRERARLAVVSKEWQQIVTNNWTSVRLEPATSYDSEELFQRGKHLAWLGRLARRSPHTLQSIYIHLLAAPHSLIPEFGLHCCTCLRRLELKPKHRGHDMYPASITPEAMQRLSLLIHLEVLSISLEGSSRNIDLVQGSRTVELSLHEIALLPKLQHLDLGLDTDCRWTLAHSHESGFQSLNSLCIDQLLSWSSEWMPEVISRLEALCLAVWTPVTEETDASDAPKLTNLEYTCTHIMRSSLMPFKTSANLRMLSSTNVHIHSFKDMPSVNYDTASICLVRAYASSDIVRSWSTLRSLTELRIDGVSLGEECVMEPFTCFPALKRLSLQGCNPRRGVIMRGFAPHVGIMETLTSLRIDSRRDELTYNLGEMGLMLPALRECTLLTSQGEVMGELCCSTLETLSIKGNRLPCEWPQASLLRDLPCLHTLSLQVSPKGLLDNKAMLAQSLPALVNLRELSLIMTLGMVEASPRHDDTIDVLLGAISGVTGLTALEIFIPICDINLSLVNFPSLMVLSVGCKAVKFDGSGIGSSLQRRDIVLDLQFIKTSDEVREQFQACQDSVVPRPAGDGLIFFNVRRRPNHVLTAKSPIKMKDSRFTKEMVYFLCISAGFSSKRNSFYAFDDHLDEQLDLLREWESC